jgi:hypothetical protein
LEVGTQDLTLDIACHLDKEGTLLVEQLMTNAAPQFADFRCYLSAKGRRPQRIQVYRLGPNLDRKVYRFPNGRGLVSKEMLLEIEELNGPRVLKYRFVPEDKPKPPDESAERGEQLPDTQVTTTSRDSAKVFPDRS